MVLSALFGAGMALAAAAPTETPPAIANPPPQTIAPGVWLIPGVFPPGREPDGNTVVFRAPKGLIVMDTGRHVQHRQAIEAFALARGAPIVAIVNSHWHLDHVSGNPALKRAYPRARVYASNAINDALGGFLAKSAADGRAALGSGKLDPGAAADVRGDIATIEAGAALRPDVVIDASRTRTIGGLTLRINLAPDAATAGDVWLYEPKSRVAAVGDLVTLPVPFLDTACPAGWKAALAQIWATPFSIALPGHGAPMSRAQFATYRRAFEALIDCAASVRTASACAAEWVRDAGPLIAAGDIKRAEAMGNYYVGDVLRPNGGRSAYCKVG